MCYVHQGKKRVEEKAFNYSRPSSWKGFQDSELGMRQSFMGTPLLSPPPLPALERRVDYMSTKKKNQYFSLHAALIFYLFCFCRVESLNNCWSVTKLMTLFCLLQNNSTVLGMCIGMLSCPSLAVCCGISDWAIPDIRLVTTQKKLPLSSLVCCYVGLKAEDCQENFQDAGTNSSLM